MDDGSGPPLETIRGAAISHSFWWLSRFLLALSLVSIAHIVEIPLEEFLSLREETDVEARRENELLDRVQETKKILNASRVAVEKFERAVILWRGAHASTGHDPGRVRIAVQEAGIAVESIYRQYLGGAETIGDIDQIVPELARTLDGGVEQMELPKSSKIQLLESDLELAHKLLRKIESKFSIEAEEIARSKKQSGWKRPGRDGT